MADEQVCDGCGRANLSTREYGGYQFCPPCAANREVDPVVEVQGRMLHRSEAVEQGVLADTAAEDADDEPASARRRR